MGYIPNRTIKRKLMEPTRQRTNSKQRLALFCSKYTLSVLETTQKNGQPPCVATDRNSPKLTTWQISKRTDQKDTNTVTLVQNVKCISTTNNACSLSCFANRKFITHTRRNQTTKKRL